MNKIVRMHDVDLRHQRVLIREDFNVPIHDGVITSDARLQAALPTIRLALAQQAAVILLAHLGRPTEGQFDETLSLAPVAQHLSHLLHKPVRLVRDWLNGIDIEPGEVVLCENVRFNVGEKANEPQLSQRIARLADIVVMDAFAAAHRAEASTEGILRHATVACAGPLLLAEIDALSQALRQPDRPWLALVGGAKVSTKLRVLERIADIADLILVGGGILNTFMLAQGLNVGQSLVETSLVPDAQRIMAKLQARHASIPMPLDVIVADRFDKNAHGHCKKVADIGPLDLILDIGPDTATAWAKLIQQAKTIVWNGPVGVFEFPAFAKGTETIARAIAASPAFSIAGGGDTIAAIEQFHIEDSISYISTGGGAFLEYLEGKDLPAIKALYR